MSNIDPQLLDALRRAKSIVVMTGAGVSPESGIPTFRDAMDGLWAKFDPAQLATPGAFARDPELVTRWYDERRCKVAACKPNAGHFALAELQKRVASDGREFTLVTQNVDRLHQAAGSSGVIELHGSLWEWRCTTCGETFEELGPAFDTFPPRCACGGVKRPGVVWFGESLPVEQLQLAESATMKCDLFMVLGTSGVVYPAAGLVDLARNAGASVLEVNPAETPLTTRANWRLRGTTGAILPQLVRDAFA